MRKFLISALVGTTVLTGINVGLSIAYGRLIEAHAVLVEINRGFCGEMPHAPLIVCPLGRGSMAPASAHAPQESSLPPRRPASLKGTTP